MQQRAKWQPPVLPSDQPEIEDMSDLLPSIESSISSSASLLQHESIETPGQELRCGICGKPWPCGGW